MKNNKTEKQKNIEPKPKAEAPIKLTLYCYKVVSDKKGLLNDYSSKFKSEELAKQWYEKHGKWLEQTFNRTLVFVCTTDVVPIEEMANNNIITDEHLLKLYSTGYEDELNNRAGIVMFETTIEKEAYKIGRKDAIDVVVLVRGFDADEQQILTRIKEPLNV